MALILVIEICEINIREVLFYFSSNVFLRDLFPCFRIKFFRSNIMEVCVHFTRNFFFKKDAKHTRIIEWGKRKKRKIANNLLIFRFDWRYCIEIFLWGTERRFLRWEIIIYYVERSKEKKINKVWFCKKNSLVFFFSSSCDETLLTFHSRYLYSTETFSFFSLALQMKKKKDKVKSKKWGEMLEVNYDFNYCKMKRKIFLMKKKCCVQNGVVSNRLFRDFIYSCFLIGMITHLLII